MTDKDGWTSLRISFPIVEDIIYDVKDCRTKVEGSALYNGVDFVDTQWPKKGSLLLVTNTITHWRVAR
jgi:hypothetical protein